MSIAASHLRRSYGDFVAVDDLTFEVGAGEIVGLIGPNGAGKTTTLRSLAGILRPTSGTVSSRSSCPPSGRARSSSPIGFSSPASRATSREASISTGS